MLRGIPTLVMIFKAFALTSVYFYKDIKLAAGYCYNLISDLTGSVVNFTEIGSQVT
jgi:hypothetical protein